MASQTRRQKSLIVHLLAPEFTTNGPMMAKLACQLRTVLRGKLTLLVEHCCQFLLMDTDIGMPYDYGVPPVVRERTAALASRFRTAYGVLNEQDLITLPLPQRTAIFLSLKEIEAVDPIDDY